MLKAMVWGITLVVLSDVTATSGMLFVLARSIVFATAILSLFLGKTKGACLLIILLVAGRAIQLTESGDGISLASIWTGSVGPGKWSAGQSSVDGLPGTGRSAERIVSDHCPRWFQHHADVWCRRNRGR